LKKEEKRVQIRRARSQKKKPPPAYSPANRHGDFPERKMHALTPGRRLRIVARTEITMLSWHGRVENLAALRPMNDSLGLSSAGGMSSCTRFDSGGLAVLAISMKVHWHLCKLYCRHFQGGMQKCAGQPPHGWMTTNLNSNFGCLP